MESVVSDDAWEHRDLDLTIDDDAAFRMKERPYGTMPVREDKTLESPNPWI